MKKIYQRVVLIDDEEIQNKIHRKIIQQYLGTYTIEIVSFTNPQQALLYLETEDKNKINTLVLLDLNMPQMEGWDFLEHLGAIDLNHIHIHIVTSSVLQDDIQRARSHPKITGLTRKPLSSAVNGLLVDTLAAMTSADLQQ